MPCYAIDGRRPALASDAWIAPSAYVIGDARLGEAVSVWFGAVIRADNTPILVGAHTNIQESAMLHSDPGAPLAIGEEVTVGHHAILHGCTVGDRALIGMGAVVLNRAVIGADCIVGRGAYIGTGVRVGDRCKIQNYALVYEPAVLEDGVFVGPAVVFTNDTHPRAVTPDGTLKSADEWEAVGVTVRQGASIGARSVCVAPVEVGRWALVAAGSVVVKDVPDFALVAGVPARRIGWVGRAGVRLVADGDQWVCPQTGERYAEADGTLREVAAA